MRDLWFNTSNNKQHMNCVGFLRKVVDHKPDWVWERPSPEKAPWHWRCQVFTPGGHLVWVNVWPHKGKWQIGHGLSGIGWNEFWETLPKALAEEDTNAAAS